MFGDDLKHEPEEPILSIEDMDNYLDTLAEEDEEGCCRHRERMQ